MGLIKTPQEIERIKKSCQIIKEVKKIVAQKLVTGITTLALDQLAEREIIKRGAKPAFKGYMGFKHTLCISINEELIHGIPSQRVIKDGDLVKVDMGCIYQKMYSDTAFTKAIGANIKPRDKKLIAVAQASFWAGVNVIKKGARIGDIAAAIGQYVQSQGLFVPREFTGHGIGTALHETPYVPNAGQPGTGMLLQDGMVICIEPMILQKSRHIIIKPDGWTVVSFHNLKTSHYEQTILINNGKPEILTEDF